MSSQPGTYGGGVKMSAPAPPGQEMQFGTVFGGNPNDLKLRQERDVDEMRLLPQELAQAGSQNGEYSTSKGRISRCLGGAWGRRGVMGRFGADRGRECTFLGSIW